MQTKFKLTRVDSTGRAYAEIVQADSWYAVISQHQYAGAGPIIKIEVVDAMYVNDTTPQSYVTGPDGQIRP